MRLSEIFIVRCERAVMKNSTAVSKSLQQFLNLRQSDTTTPVWMNGAVAIASRFSSHQSSSQARRSAAKPRVSGGRTEYHREKLAADPEYREVCRDSRRKWRARHPGYWKQYRENHPDAGPPSPPHGGSGGCRRRAAFRAAGHGTFEIAWGAGALTPETCFLQPGRELTLTSDLRNQLPGHIG